ncbi:MAG: hypothetical protein JWL80_549 [Parcubacteria group bacterium]|nr:hypothetical protein [Parcubacteria group bacterium]
MKIIHRIKHFFTGLSKKQIIWGAVGIIAVSGIAYLVFHDSTTKTFVSAEVGDITEQVLVTGTTKSSSTVDLGFERTGKVVSAPFDVGNKVYSGQTLAVLGQSDLRASLLRAQANLNEALVQLDTTTKNTSSSYDNAYSTALLALKDSFAKTEDAVNFKADQFFNNAHNSNPEFAVTSNQNGIVFPFNASIPYTTRLDLGNERADIEKVITDWRTSLSQVVPGQDLGPVFTKAETSLSRIKTFVDHLSSAVSSVSVYNNYQYQDAIDAYKTTASGARTQVGNAITDLQAAKQKFSTAPIKTSTASGSTYNDILSEQARVDSLRADVASIQADIAKTVISAPISGIITRQEAKVGQIVTPGTSLISIISDSKLQIEANVSEVNIAKIRIGNTVTMTFDAFPDAPYTGKVVYIDPGQTIVDGVATYKVTVAFDTTPGVELRSGLTANLKIETAKKEGIVKIPAYAVERVGDKSFVTVQVGETSTRQEVTTGLKGADGTIEVISGLKGDEQILVVTTS